MDYCEKFKKKKLLYPAKVAIIILNWNGKKDTLECLESVFKIEYGNFDVIVVDNGSNDGSVKAIQNKFPEVNVLETGKNLGYAGGNNFGIRYALKKGTDFILILNNDVVVDSQLLNEFINAWKLFPEGGIFAGKIYYFSQPKVIWYAGAKRVRHTAYFKHIGQGCRDNGKDFNTILETDYASGCAFFVNVSVFKKIGLFEERFFLTYEESDFCYRARRAGFKCYFVPEAKVWHKVSISFGGENSALFKYFMARNKLLWAEKNLNFFKRLEVYGRAVYEFLKFIIPPRFYLSFSGNASLPEAIYRSMLEYKKSFIAKYKDPNRKAYRWGLRDYVLRRFGDCPDSVRSLVK